MENNMALELSLIETDSDEVECQVVPSASDFHEADGIVKLMNDLKKVETIWNNDKPYVTVRGSGGKLVRHKIMDYGSMSHREYLSHLGEPNPETAQKYINLRKKKLARFTPEKARWGEMETYANHFADQKKNGPGIFYVLGYTSGPNQPSTYIDWYLAKLKMNEQIVVYLGVGDTGTYIEARDFQSSDIIDSSVSTEQRERILQEFAIGQFQILFISYDLRDEINGELGPFWDNVRAVIIEECDEQLGPFQFKSLLKACSTGYHSKLPAVHVITLLRAKFASQAKQTMHTYMQMDFDAHTNLATLNNIAAQSIFAAQSLRRFAFLQEMMTTMKIRD